MRDQSKYYYEVLRREAGKKSECEANMKEARLRVDQLKMNSAITEEPHVQRLLIC